LLTQSDAVITTNSDAEAVITNGCRGIAVSCIAIAAMSRLHRLTVLSAADVA